jgi:exonuclease III
MRIFTWNCNGALRKKTHLIDSVDADLVIVQECEDPGQSTNAYLQWANNYIWFGDNKNKGIGVFSRKRYRFRSLEIDDYGNKLMLPFRFSENETALAVWTKRGDKLTRPYIGQY